MCNHTLFIYFSSLKAWTKQKKRVENNRHHNRCVLFSLTLLLLFFFRTLRSILFFFPLNISSGWKSVGDECHFFSYAWWMYVRWQNVITLKRVHDFVAKNDEIEFFCWYTVCMCFDWIHLAKDGNDDANNVHTFILKYQNEICLCLHWQWITFSKVLFALFHSFAFAFNWVKNT